MKLSSPKRQRKQQRNFYSWLNSDEKELHGYCVISRKLEKKWLRHSGSNRGKGRLGWVDVSPGLWKTGFRKFRKMIGMLPLAKNMIHKKGKFWKKKPKSKKHHGVRSNIPQRLLWKRAGGGCHRETSLNCSHFHRMCVKGLRMYTQGGHALCSRSRLGERWEGQANVFSLGMRPGSHFTYIISFYPSQPIRWTYDFCVSKCDIVTW